MKSKIHEYQKNNKNIVSKNLKLLTIVLLTILASCSKDDSKEPLTNPNLAVSGINPTMGRKNTTVTITGVDFSPNLTSNKITLNGFECTVNTASTTELSVTIPRGAGTGNLVITVGNSNTQSPTFTYEVTPSVVSTIAGDGTAGFLDATTGTAAKFNIPQDVAIDATGNLYVVDTGNHKIRKISPIGAVTTLAGNNAGFLDGTKTAAQFNNPYSVAVDSAGNLYIADTLNQKIRKISPTGVVTTLAGTTSGFADGVGLTEAKFVNPTGVTVDAAGNVYVADAGNSKIRKISTMGMVTTLAGSNDGFLDATGTAAKFSIPRGVASDIFGNVFVADTYNYKIRKIILSGAVTTMAGTTQGFVDGIGLTEAKFSNNTDVALDAAGNVYVADKDNHKIRKISPTGAVTTLAGTTEGFADGAGTVAQFNSPYGVAVDAAGNVYVADTNNHKIRKITQD
jgi:sugar lactone lactonase YvrE